LVLGPAGLAYDSKHDLLYVDSQADDTIHVISKAEKSRGGQGTGQVLVNDATHLHGPMGLVLAPNGNLIVANSDATNADPNQPSELVEYTPQGAFVGQKSVDPMNGGAFGLGIGFNQLAAVDDNGPTLEIFPL
jgi:DNA-binding beta-propeller fold protein YncE